MCPAISKIAGRLMSHVARTDAQFAFGFSGRVEILVGYAPCCLGQYAADGGASGGSWNCRLGPTRRAILV